MTEPKIVRRCPRCSLSIKGARVVVGQSSARSCAPPEKWTTLSMSSSDDTILEAEMRRNRSPEAVTLSFAGPIECARHGESYA